MSGTRTPMVQSPMSKGLSDATYGSLNMPGAVAGTVVVTAGVPIITATSNWGIDSAGSGYYDAAGAATGEDAVLTLDSTGYLLTRIA